MLNIESMKKLYGIRWIVALTVMVIGCQVGIISVMWGTWHQFVVDYFGVTKNVADNVNLSAALGAAIAAFPSALIAVKYPSKVKVWIQAGLAVMGVAGLMESLAVARGNIAILIFGQLLGGVSSCWFLMSAPLVATAWFGEREQATFFGMGFFSFCIGKLLSTTLPSILSALNIQDVTELQKSHALVSMMAVVTSLDISLLLFVTGFLPNLPQVPPSRAEAQRLALIGNSTISFRQILRNFGSEFKILLTDKISVIILFIETTLIAMYTVQFIMMPVPDFSTHESNSRGTFNHTNSTFVRNRTELLRSQALMAFSIGGMIGSIGAGLATDIFKKYNPMAQFICGGILTCGILILIAVQCKMFILQVVACGFYGVFSFSANSFFTEILKQYVYPHVREIIFGMSLFLFANIFTLLYVPILRLFLEHYGLLGFLSAFCIILMICEILALSINPELKRFHYDQEQTRLIPDTVIEDGHSDLHHVD